MKKLFKRKKGRKKDVPMTSLSKVRVIPTPEKEELKLADWEIETVGYTKLGEEMFKKEDIEKYKKETGKNAIWGGKFTKQFISYMESRDS